MYKLRDYQAESLHGARAILDISEDTRPMVQSPTGSGKSILQWHIVNKTIERGGSVLFGVAGRNIVTQFSNHLTKSGIDHTVMMSGEDFNSYSDTIVCSVDTLRSWFFKEGCKYNIDNIRVPDYLLIDEGRLWATPSRRAVIDEFAGLGSRIIGFDATPKAKDLDKAFTDIIPGKTTPWLIEHGRLSPVKHYSPASQDEDFMRDLKNLKPKAGEYTAKDAEELMNKKVLIGEIVDNYETITMKEYGERKPFVVCCCTKTHARSVQDAFLSKGYDIAYIDGDTKQDDRSEMFDAVQNGSLLGIISIMTMAYGVDIPNLHIGIVARPAKSLVLYLQFGGRILRTHDGKSHAVLIDHSGVIQEHGYLDDAYSWSLDPDNPVTNETQKEREEKEGETEVDITCSNCAFVYQNSPICPQCQHENIIDIDAHNVVYLNTSLIEQEREIRLALEQQGQLLEWTKSMKTVVWRDKNLKTDAARVNRLNKLVAMKSKSTYPPQFLNELESSPVTKDASNYMRYYNIRMSAGRRKQY